MGPSLLFGGNLGICDDRPPQIFLVIWSKSGRKPLKQYVLTSKIESLCNSASIALNIIPRDANFDPLRPSLVKKSFVFNNFHKLSILVPKIMFFDDFEPFLFIHKRFPSILTIKSWYIIFNFSTHPNFFFKISPPSILHQFPP